LEQFCVAKPETTGKIGFSSDILYDGGKLNNKLSTEQGDGDMEQVTRNVYAETRVRGCNPAYVVTSGGVVVIDTPQPPTYAVKMRKEAESHGEIRYLNNTE
jgi:hypothetical protein